MMATSLSSKLPINCCLVEFNWLYGCPVLSENPVGMLFCQARFLHFVRWKFSVEMEEFRQP
ncbi:hypothetical protein SLEP1_g12626 [Rubroshorea leprosula]|uniref:Uncharacterized protein n=1 Tax=Rubroshorea leprosula TaxID=152421 RepID=A0AAV5ID49_9ROSI|nr:hypothetical protein SLEP1_g12626 [Rubroshorea leprosula]